MGDVIAIVRTSLTPSPGSAVVYPTPRSGSTIWAARRQESTSSPSVSILSLTSMNSSPLRLLRPPVFAATSTWLSTPPRISSTSGSGFTLSTFCVSTKCCHAGADRLQTGMIGAFGKPQGTVARVRIGQPLMSVRTYDRHKGSVIDALRRTKFKFPGRQKIFVSKKWGFTKFERDDYEEMRANGRLQPDGSHVKYLPEHGPLAKWCKVQAELAGI